MEAQYWPRGIESPGPPTRASPRRSYSVSVELVLGGRNSLGQQRLHRVGSAVDEQRQLFALGGGEVTQHERGRVHPARRPADAEPDPVVVAGAERPGDRAQAVVPVVAATE